MPGCVVYSMKDKRLCCIHFFMLPAPAGCIEFFLSLNSGLFKTFVSDF